MQYGTNDQSAYNFEKHADEIRDLKSKWEREAKQLEVGFELLEIRKMVVKKARARDYQVTRDTSEADAEWQSKLDALKEQKQEKEAKLDKIEEKMTASVAALKE
ncbi:hypothetical protein Pmar_PMAR023788, partial [Perkinsus marinus ATCC 50983]